jgi:UDP-glucuronate 4-epimerase
MQNILVTGGAGFIGSHLVKRLLDEGNKVIAIDNLNDYYEPSLKKDRLKFVIGENPNFEFYKKDICDYSALKGILDQKKISSVNQIDLIIHLAAQPGVRYSLVNPQIYGMTNCLGTINIFELARNYNIKKVIYASSSSVYGDNEKLPFSETDTADSPISLYGATKRFNEILAYNYHKTFNLKMAGLRFFTVYGPWGRPDMAYFKFANLITQEKPIDVYNFGQQRRNFTYIDDIINGIALLLDKDFDYEIFNLGNDKSVELEKFISLLGVYLNKKITKNYLPVQDGDVSDNRGDIEKAKKFLDFDPRTNIEDGLKIFTDWYKEYYKINN